MKSTAGSGNPANLFQTLLANLFQTLLNKGTAMQTGNIRKTSLALGRRVVGRCILLKEFVHLLERLLILVEEL